MRACKHFRNLHPHRRLCWLIACCIPLILLITLRHAYSSPTPLPNHILVLKSADGGPYAEFTHQFTRALQAGSNLPANRISTAVTENPSRPLSTLGPNDLVIAVGTHATANVLSSSTQAAILSVLVPRQTAVRLTKEAARHSHKITTIYLDQPPSRYLRLAQLIMPKSAKLGIILGPATEAEKAELDRAATHSHMTLLYAAMEPDKTNPLGALQSIIRDCDALLALPDPRVYNRYSLPPLLLTTFRYRVPVIGFSPAFVNAGAVAGVYSTPAQIGQQAARMVLHGNLPGGGHYPSQFHIKFNFTVAQALDITLPSTEDAEKLLRADNGAT